LILSTPFVAVMSPAELTTRQPIFSPEHPSRSFAPDFARSLSNTQGKIYRGLSRCYRSVTSIPRLSFSDSSAQSLTLVLTPFLHSHHSDSHTI